MRLPALAALAAAAAGLLLWVALREPAPPGPASADAAGSAGASGGTRASAVPSAASAPATAGGAKRAATALPPPKPSLSNDFLTARNYKALYERLAQSPEGLTPEGQYVLYRILRACASGAERRARMRRPGTPEERQELAESIPDTDPYKAKRLAAWDQATADKCVGLSGLVTTEAELAEKLRASASAGDPKARALQVQEEIFRAMRASGERTRPGLSDAQVGTLREAMASKDPEALLIASSLLGMGFRGTTLLVGPDQEVADRGAFHNAARLLACEYGYACGENHPEMVEACAFRGHCASGNLPDFIGYYESTAYGLTLQDRYRSILRNAVETGDWSAIAVRRGARAPR